MTKFEVSCIKGPQGEIVVNGRYVSGAEPVYVERVVLEELDGAGNAIGSSTHHVHRNIDPTPGSSMLVATMPSGSNVKGARAIACYVLMDKVAKSAILNL
jgi:hypothetical protein